eukprot:TRINITY_DN3389_c0_g1_i1.p2 TRINITY_DN3389_c0_g1~~TRINITY_DN3389_c0_g1_i1.p2  ORF type:complete len:144 (+),score=37.98 TRINITY_DN3389_c0_g1_i1:73-504(+)
MPLVPLPLTSKDWAFPAVGVSSVLAVYLYQGYRVGAARKEFKIEAPATTGHPIFERVYRAHQNTVEGLVVFLPSITMFSYFVDPQVGGYLSFVYAAARLIYGEGYARAAKNREVGAVLSGLVTLTTFGWATYAAGKLLVQKKL